MQKVLENFEQLTERDVRSAPMGVPGEDIILSEKASKAFPYSVECKNQEKLSIWSAIDQSEDIVRQLTPLLVFRRNNSDTYCVLKFEEFIKLLKLKRGENNGKK